jgi:Bacterial transcriptional regulator
MGRVLRAGLPDDQVDRVLAKADLRRLTSRTIRSPQALREEIDRRRRQDYAIVDQELEVGAALRRGPDPRPGRRGGGGHQRVDAGLAHHGCRHAPPPAAAAPGDS